MPSSIAHMLVSKMVRENLKTEQEGGIKDFVEKVLEKNSPYMELGSIGPDLPYYESMVTGAKNILLDRSDIPLGVDQWSYQLHSKEPNIFPLKMIEITWKETAIEKDDWEEDDYMKFAFVCGYLTHMATDQIIHPLVNLIAGPYYKRGNSREKHRECEVYQDIFIYDALKTELGKQDFKNERFNSWCDIIPDTTFRNTPVWFRYLIQKSFVESHAVTPKEDSIEDWVDGTLLFLRAINDIGPFLKAFQELSNNPESSQKFKEYILLETLPNATDDKKEEFRSNIKGKNYKNFFNDAIDLSTIYVKAAYKIYSASEIDDFLRNKFKMVVSGADLGAPLENNILQKSKKILENWN